MPQVDREQEMHAMNASLRALLEGIIDYAGLFPPAKLPLNQAIHNYAKYRDGAERWILGRFICPAARLSEVAPFVEELFESGPSLVISALGRGGSNAGEFTAGVRADAADIQSLRERYHGRVIVDAYETRLPPAVTAPADAAAIKPLLGQAAAALSAFSAPSISIACEVAPAKEWRRAWDASIHAIADARARATPSAVNFGFKWRAGGLEAAAFPSPEQVAFIIAACRDHAVPWKATAGLHDPFRHFDETLKTSMHGFLNVFTAGVLAAARRLNRATIQAILEDQEPDHFRFDDHAVHWKDVSGSTEEVAAARRQSALSFGSCSFEEPIDHLRRRGWI
jgi:hypothetical protein